jgi:hypothetical protein
MRTGERLEAALPFVFWRRKRMDRKRVAGRFVRENLDGDGGAQRTENSGAPRPKQCRTFTRAKVAEALPEIVQTFVEEAKKGSIAHAKLLTALGGLDKAEPAATKKRRGKSTVGKLIEKMLQEPEK